MTTTAPLDHDTLLQRFWIRDTTRRPWSASPHPAYVSMGEAAQMIGRSKNTVSYHHIRGQFVPPHILHNRMVFRRDDVAAWLTGQDPDRNYVKAGK